MKTCFNRILPWTVFVVLWVVLGFHNLVAQPNKTGYQVLTLEKKGRRYIYSRGDLLNFRLADDPILYHSVIADLKPGYVTINFGQEESIPVDVHDFRQIIQPRQSRLARTIRKVGFILPIAGGLFFGADALNTSHRGEADFDWKPAAGIAGSMALVGVAMIFATSDRKIRIGNSWELNTVNADNYRFRRKLPGEI